MKTVRRYSLNKFKNLFKQRNYKILKVSYFTFFLFLPIILLRLSKNIINLFLKNRDLKSDIFKINSFLNYILIKFMKLESCVINYASLPIGIHLVIVLKKNNFYGGPCRLRSYYLSHVKGTLYY